MALNFISKRSDGRRNAALELTLQVRVMLDVDDDRAVSVSEHDCAEPGCCGTRTVVLVLSPGQPTKTIKFDKPIESVTRADLTVALAPLSSACMHTQDTGPNDASASHSTPMSMPTEQVSNFK